MAQHSKHSLVLAAARLDVGDRATISNPPDWLPPRMIDQLALGFVETISNFEWTIGINCEPASAFAIGVVEGDDELTVARADSDTSTLTQAYSATATSLSVITLGRVLWTTTPSDFPFDVNINGVRITVTNITGASNPQTFTVTRSVDGFDIELPAGASVSLWNPTYVGLV
jgi:hypothetical protein